jgi:hypothetical protein
MKQTCGKLKKRDSRKLDKPFFREKMNVHFQTKNPLHRHSREQVGT